MGIKIVTGDCRQKMAEMAPNSIQTCVTSPPYWGLRDYGVDGQIGLEATPEAFVETMVEVFREVWRVLRDDGTLWLNLGDSYAGGGGFSPTSPCNVERASGKQWGSLHPANMTRHEAKEKPKHARIPPLGLKPKDMIGIPWRVAFALQADGWYLRSDIIWAKPNPMPEGVTDRPTKSHEFLFLLTKKAKYYYDAEAIREPYAGPMYAGVNNGAVPGGDRNDARKTCGISNPAGRNKRDVWTVTTAPYKGAHFATFPPKLIEPCILAGSRKGDTVLDPFGGAGTTGLVADRLGRDAVLVELNPEYAQLAGGRVYDDAPLFAAVSVEATGEML